MGGLISRVFKPKLSPAPSIGYGEGEDLILKWGVIVPHTRRAPGASSWDGKYNEYVYGNLLANQLDLPYATRDEGGVAGAASALARAGVTASLEPHYNAYNGRAHGAEILVMEGDEISYMYAERMLEEFAEVFPSRRIRGVKEIGRGGRGYNNLRLARKHMKVALLSEMFFGDNREDWLPVEDQAKFWKGQIK
jgi:hypothetical protein